jgi:hypothetical protein
MATRRGMIAARLAIRARGARSTDELPLRGLGPTRPTPAPRGFAAPVAIGPRALELQPHVTIVEDLEAVVDMETLT